MQTDYIFSDGGAKDAFPKLAKRTGNCVIRAIALATEQPYKKVWNEMLEISAKTGYFPNHNKVSTLYIQKYGFQEIKYGKTNIRMNELGHAFLKTRKNQWIILYIKRHWVSIKNNVIYDTWDSRKNSWGDSPRVFRAYVKNC
jgi:hypothetical protein